MMCTNAIPAVQRDVYRIYNIVIGDNIFYLIRIININIKSYIHICNSQIGGSVLTNK